jgi:hypothetical protein
MVPRRPLPETQMKARAQVNGWEAVGRVPVVPLVPVQADVERRKGVRQRMDDQGHYQAHGHGHA